MEIPIALSLSPVSSSAFCYFLMACMYVGIPFILKKKILHLISHLPPDTAPFSAPLSVKLLKELLILVSFTSFPFPPHHSTETILVSVIRGPVITISSGQYSALFLIDPSAALDTIRHFFPLP